MEHSNPKAPSRPSNEHGVTTTTERPLSYDDIVDTVGRIDNASIAAILGTGASLEELAEAFAWFSQESDAMGEARHPLSGRVEQVYCILVGDNEFPNER